MFDTLDEVLSDALARLMDGATNPGSPWRNLTLATAGLDGTPQARTVVLRRLDTALRALDLHTDTRSAKHAELRAHPAAALHGWDASARVQLRLTGLARLHTHDDVADAARAALRPDSRATYGVLPGPGSVLATPDQTGRADDAAARAAFCVVRLSMTTLEWLHLGQNRHTRARFDWTGKAAQNSWLAP